MADVVVNSNKEGKSQRDVIVELAEIKLDDKFLELVTGIGEPSSQLQRELDQMAKLLLKRFRHK